MRQWGGVSKYRTLDCVKKFESLLAQVQTVTKMARGKSGDQSFMSPGEFFTMEMGGEDCADLARESVWGTEEDAIAAVIISKNPVSLVPAGDGKYKFDESRAKRIFYDGSIPDAEWTPVLRAGVGDRNHVVSMQDPLDDNKTVKTRLVRVRVGVFPVGESGGRDIEEYVNSPEYFELLELATRPGSDAVAVEGILRAYVRMILVEGPSGPGVTADPTNSAGGFYPYEVERGADIHGYWYKSPGDKGSSDPMRPEDAAEYIGM
jgi:hypothetical protein